MRVAIISDIHGNALALQTVLDDLTCHPCNQTVCLGDAIQGGAQPAETVRLLRELGCPVVMGNADDFLLSLRENGTKTITPEQLDVREWSLSKLSDDDRAYIAGFQWTVTLDLPDGRRLLAFHGSPTAYGHVILPSTPDEEVDEYLGAYAGSFLCGGHTHLQQIREIGREFFFNPGSVGLAYNHRSEPGATQIHPWAEYAVLTVDDGALSLEFRRIPFDVGRVIEIIRSSGRPHAEELVAEYGPIDS